MNNLPQIDPQKVKDIAAHGANVIEHGLLFLIKFVEVAGPIAAQIGPLIGNPAVTAGGAAATELAKVAEKAIDASQAQN